MNPNWQHTDPLAVQKRSQGVDQRQARKKHDGDNKGN